MNFNIIAIDGPAGSGKSTLAREIAKAKGFYYFDSGAYYRAVTYYFIRMYHSLKYPNPFYKWIVEQDLDRELQNIHLDTNFVNAEENQIFLNKENVSDVIRTPDVTEEIKHLAGLRVIRDFVNKNLYYLSEKYKLVMDGRDIGTEVFPDAKFKFFLIASAEVRAKRRWEEWKAKGIEMDYANILSDIQKRDKSDEEREIAPLKKAPDALELDTSQLTKKQVSEKILAVIEGI